MTSPSSSVAAALRHVHQRQVEEPRCLGQTPRCVKGLVFGVQVCERCSISAWLAMALLLACLSRLNGEGEESPRPSYLVPHGPAAAPPPLYAAGHTAAADGRRLQQLRFNKPARGEAPSSCSASCGKLDELSSYGSSAFDPLESAGRSAKAAVLPAPPPALPQPAVGHAADVAFDVDVAAEAPAVAAGLPPEALALPEGMVLPEAPTDEEKLSYLHTNK